MKVLPLSPYDNNGEVTWTLPGLDRPLHEYSKSLREAIGFMNKNRVDHDDGSPEYYIRRDLTMLAEACERLAILEKLQPEVRVRQIDE